MLIARSTTPHDVVVEELPDPTPGAGEVVCRVLACGVCGSDVSDGYVAKKLPGVLGHEVVGEVLRTGAGVTSVAAGDRVVIHHHAPCGDCRRCRRGHETLCEQFRATRLEPGGFAEQVLIEAALVPELLPLGRDRPARRDVRRAARLRAARARPRRAAGGRSPARRRRGLQRAAGDRGRARARRGRGLDP